MLAFREQVAANGRCSRQQMLIATKEQRLRRAAGNGADALARHPRSRLHPAKIKTGIRRRWFQREMERTPLYRTDGLVTLGDPEYGGWVVPERLIGADWTCYSVGAGGDISFDMELIDRWGIRVRSIDPV